MPRILAAKVLPPSLPTTYVPRPLLEGRLDGALNRRLTVLIAGAGFGKSTLLAAWTARHRSAWYTWGRTRPSSPSAAPGWAWRLRPTRSLASGAGATGAAVLRDLALRGIEDTGGLFVLPPEHEQSYGDAFVEGCRKTGVPCEELTVAEARRREPLLTPRLSRVFAVPDGTFVEKYDIAMDVGAALWEQAAKSRPDITTGVRR